MSLALWLLVVGTCDLVRAARDTTSLSRRLLIAGAGVALLVFAAIALEPSGPRMVVLLLGWSTAFLLWLFGSAVALSGGGVAARATAFAGLGLGVAFGLLFDPRVAPLAVTPPPLLSGWTPTQLLGLAGAVVVQLATANVAVRLVLDAVGVPASTNEKKLKGGRLLGPMERLFIVALVLAGEITAASVVVGAKGLLRFPELQRDAKLPGPSDVTEYFLIGSFASWLFALAGAGLTLLVQ